MIGINKRESEYALKYIGIVNLAIILRATKPIQPHIIVKKQIISNFLISSNLIFCTIDLRFKIYRRSLKREA